MASEEEIVGMAEDIKKIGLRVPIEIWVDDSKDPTEDDSPRPLLGGRGGGRDYPQSLLEGRCRREALRRLNIIDCSKAPYRGHGIGPVRYLRASENPDIAADPVGYVLSKNLHRRHLSIEQKKKLIYRYKEANPNASNRKIARIFGVSDHTVAEVLTAQNAQIEHSPIERANAEVRTKPDASVTEIAKSANVSRATAQKAKKVVAAGEIKTEPKAKQELKPDKRFRAEVRKTFDRWGERWSKEIGVSAFETVLYEEWVKTARFPW